MKSDYWYKVPRLSFVQFCFLWMAYQFIFMMETPFWVTRCWNYMNEYFYMLVIIGFLFAFSQRHPASTELM